MNPENVTPNQTPEPAAPPAVPATETNIFSPGQTVQPTMPPAQPNVDAPGAHNSQPIPMVPPTKKSKKGLILTLALLLVIAGGAAAYYLSSKKTEPVASNTPSTVKLTLPNQPKQLNDQFGTENFASGYVSYKPEKLKAVTTTLPKLDTVLTPLGDNTADKPVMFITDLTYNGANNSRRLLMYDFTSKITYLISEDNSTGSYSNAKIMSNHYVVYVNTVETDPLTSTNTIKITDLNTGTSKIVTTGKAGDVPASLCCNVSPDGLRLVIAQPNKFVIYQAGESLLTTFPANVQPFPVVQGSDNSDYAASQRNSGYPGIIWLDSNRFMYAKSHPMMWTVDADGSHAKTANNGLAIYNLDTGRSTDVARTSDLAIKWFTVDGNAVIMAGYMPNVSGVTDDKSGIIIYKINNFTDSSSQALELVRQKDYQSTLVYDRSSKVLYIQPVGSDGSGVSKVLQALDTSAGKASSVTIKGFNFPEIGGIIGPDRMIINDSYGTSNNYNVYNLKSGTAAHIFNTTSN